MSEQPEYLNLYDREYFMDGTRSGYKDYATCSGVMRQWARLTYRVFRPESVLDFGAAYGFVVGYYRSQGLYADGVEPSEYALEQAGELLIPGYLPDKFDLSVEHKYDLVLGTELMEHIPEEDVHASLMRMSQHSKQYLVLLICPGDGPPILAPGQVHDVSHVTLKPRIWWELQLDETGMVTDQEKQDLLNNHAMAKAMHWDGRFYVRKHA